MIKYLLLVLLLPALAACSSSKPAKLNHDYPAPPGIKRLSEAGACQGGAALAAVDLPLPKFPLRAKRQGRQGWVVVSLDVMTNGETANVEIIRSAPGKVFDRSARKAVKKWRFAPPGESGLNACLVFIDYRLGTVKIGQ